MSKRVLFLGIETIQAHSGKQRAPRSASTGASYRGRDKLGHAEITSPVKLGRADTSWGKRKRGVLNLQSQDEPRPHNPS